jgi:hypothetical protein
MAEVIQRARTLKYMGDGERAERKRLVLQKGKTPLPLQREKGQLKTQVDKISILLCICSLDGRWN